MIGCWKTSAPISRSYNSLLKTRIAILWLFITVASILHYVLVSPDELQFFLTQTESDPAFAFFGAVFLLIPLMMAFLSVTLKDTQNRRVNLVLGVVYTIINILHIFGCPVAHSSAHQILLVLSPIMVSLLIGSKVYSH